MSKRRFWQIHLSTAIVLMFAAGGLMALNLSRRFTADVKELSYLGVGGHIERGWPMTAFISEALGVHPDENNVNNPDVFLQNTETKNPFFGRTELVVYDYRRNPRITLAALGVNVLAAVTLLLIIAATLEFVLRRREARKP